MTAVAPVDGFTYPVTARQQLTRLTAISAALWQVADLLPDEPRVTVSVYPDCDEQIGLHLHNPAVLADAVALVEALGWDTKSDPSPSGRSIHHRWYGPLGGFLASLTWIELSPAVSVG